MKNLLIVSSIFFLIYGYYTSRTSIVIYSGTYDQTFSYTVKGKSSGYFDKKETLPMLIMLHGKQDQPIEFYHKLIRSKKMPYRIILIESPIVDFGVVGWWKYDRDIPDNAETLHKVINKLKQIYPTKGKPMIIGYRDGGDIAYYLAANRPLDYSLIFPIGGYITKERMKKERDRLDEQDYVKIFAYHATKDPVVNIKAAEVAVINLRKLNFDIELVDIEGHLDVIFDTENSEFVTQLSLRAEDAGLE